MTTIPQGGSGIPVGVWTWQVPSDVQSASFAAALQKTQVGDVYLRGGENQWINHWIPGEVTVYMVYDGSFLLEMIAM
jgi:hypothetical protein